MLNDWELAEVIDQKKKKCRKQLEKSLKANIVQH